MRRYAPLALLLSLVPLVALPAAGAPAPELVNGTYVLSFHVCDTALYDCPATPSAHEVNLAESDDGISWSLVDAFDPYQASVPDVIRRGETLFIYTPSNVVTFDVTTGAQSALQQVRVMGIGQVGFVDPSAILDADGNIVLFFLYCTEGGTPTFCFGGDTEPDFHIGSATEVAGSDGTEFALEGNRVDLASGGGTDPDIYFDGTRYVLYISSGTNITVYFSDTLHGTYTVAPDLANGQLSNGQGGVPAGHFDPATSMYWTYAHVSSGGTSASSIRRAVHPDFSSSLAANEWTTVLSASDLGLATSFAVESPGFAVNTPGVEETSTHGRTVTLTLKRHLRATGTVTAPDGWDPCKSEVGVNIQRRKAGRWRTTASTRTNADGDYRLSLADRTGRYRAKVPSFAPYDLHTCAADTSRARRHSH